MILNWPFIRDAELRSLVFQLAVRVAKAPNSVEYLKEQLRRLLEAVDEREAAAARTARPQSVPSRHIKGS